MALGDFTIYTWRCFVFCTPVDTIPADIGLHGVLEMIPCLEQYAIPLGLTIEQTKYYHKQQQEALRGLLAMKHWRDGWCGSSYPGMWNFLLDVIKDIYNIVWDQ